MRRTPWRAYAAVMVAVPLIVPFVGPGPPATQGALTFTDFLPDGGEAFPADSVVPIAWNASHGNDTWFWGNLSYSLDGGLSYPLFITRTVLPMNGSHLWRVPRFNTSAGRVQVCGFAPDGDQACRQSSGNLTILATPPYLDLLSPREGAMDMRPQEPLVFGMEGVDTATMWWTVEAFGSTLVWTASWSGDFRILTLSHAVPFPGCQAYTVRAGANATDGTPVGPYEWFITTPCDGWTIQPPVTLTSPIVVDFGKPMLTSSFTWAIAPNVTLLPSWGNYNRRLSLYPSPAFAPCTTYSFMITELRDVEGNIPVPGPVPNPFTFSSYCPLYIVWTYPADGDVDVPLTAPIIVAFSRPVNRATLSFALSPPLPLTFAWSNGDTNLTTSHAAPFAQCTTYTAMVSSPDLVPGPVPNPWSFTTVCNLPAPMGLEIVRIPPDTLRLSWTPVAGATSYRVFESSDRFAQWPWPMLGETPGTSLNATGHLTDGLSHYFVVRAVGGAMESPSSVIAAKVEFHFGYDPNATNVHWVSLPYDPAVLRKLSASEIVAEAMIPPDLPMTVVGKWDAANRSSIFFYYFRGAWRGLDFQVSGGEGLWLGAVRSFSWSVVGIESNATLNLLAGREYLLSLPYTSDYRSASDIVLELEGSLGGGANTKVTEVATWDSASQTLRRFYWTPAGWVGEDFTLEPGYAIQLRTTSAFAWTPRLLGSP